MHACAGRLGTMSERGIGEGEGGERERGREGEGERGRERERERGRESMRQLRMHLTERS